MKGFLIAVILVLLWIIAGQPTPEDVISTGQGQVTYTIQEPPQPQPQAIQQPTAVSYPTIPPPPATAVPQPQVIIVQQEAPPAVQPAANTIYIEVTPDTWFADGIRTQNTLRAQTGIGHPECHAPMICD